MSVYDNIEILLLARKVHVRVEINTWKFLHDNEIIFQQNQIKIYVATKMYVEHTIQCSKYKGHVIWILIQAYSTR